MKILVAGIGNIFFGDDAFGCEVIRALRQRALPQEVTVTDFGIRGYDLAYALTNDFDAVILVDAAPRNSVPGTLYLIEPDTEGTNDSRDTMMDGHAMSPITVIKMAKSFGRVCEKLYLVGCEPETCENGDDQMGLSPKVQEAIPQALAMIDSLVNELLGIREQEIASLSLA